MSGLDLLFWVAIVVIVVLSWDGRHHHARWDREDDE